MENDYVAQAKAAYKSGDFQSAINLYNQCLQDDAVVKNPGDVGFLYHQMGNCLLQMRNYEGALEAYTQAAADSNYDACGAVNSNMGKVYASMHDYENAVAHFEIAVSDANYPSRYKAYFGMGNALLKLGKNAEAGVAFREAALDENNPDPSKALLNLGVCFMALNRPNDAIQSYEAALQFDMDPMTRNKMYANLGQAYVAIGQMQKAMNAFDAALADKTYFLNDSAGVDYRRAATAVATGTATNLPIIPDQSNDMSGLDVVKADESPVTAADVLDQPMSTSNSTEPADEGEAGYFDDQADGYATPDDRFFNASEEELEEYGKKMAKKERKRRGTGLKVFIVILIIILAIAGAGVYAYTQGYGYPSQETVVEQAFDGSGSDSDVYSSSLTSSQIDTLKSLIDSNGTVTINSIDRGMSSSTVSVTTTTDAGGTANYNVTLVRDVIGWKISDIQLAFASQQ
jgi:tetratricopeptide (TPR) repeat protein